MIAGLFPLVHCGPCAAERLAFRELDAEGALIFVCAICGSAAAPSRAVDDSVLSAQGLRVREKDPIEAKLPPTKGCKNAGTCSSSRSGAVSSCSTGGCSGCSTGGCGS